MQIPAVVLTTLSSIPAATPEGLPTANKWPLLQTIGVFVGIPLAAGLLITALVVLQAAAKRPGHPGGVTAVFTGPHAGEVDARGGDGRLSRGTGPRTESGEHSGQHREIAQPGGGGGGEQGGMFSDLLGAAGEDPDLVSPGHPGGDDADENLRADENVRADEDVRAGQDVRTAQPGAHAVGGDTDAGVHAGVPAADADADTGVGAHAIGSESRGGRTGGSGARW